ncbi:MAG: ADP-ribosyl-[dinitrogen reductase] hydrolase [Bradymonadia bacterium]|jgi:ADP-ribosyl-[dinitrogen reductase] hydrolase
MTLRQRRAPFGLTASVFAQRDKDDVSIGMNVETPVTSTVRRSSFNARDRMTGLLMGAAIGDALGMPVESIESEQTLRALHRLGGIRHFLAPQPHVLKSLRRLRPGCWTDETQLIVAISRAIITEGTLDYDVVADAFVHAFETLELRGWDATTKQACRRLAQGTDRTRSGNVGGSGNAVAARIAPIAAWSFLRGDNREQLLEHCINVGIMTHHDPRAVTAAYLISLLIRDALSAPRRWMPSPERYTELIEEARWAEEMLATRIGVSDDPISQHLEEMSDALDCEPLELAEFCNGATSYACHSVTYVIALLCGRPWEFEAGVVAAVNGGGDTDSNGAMVGAVLGAAYGLRKLPKGFVEKLEEAEMLRECGALLGALK